MRVCALASGSSGNCFYVENELKGKNQGFLIDAGISARQISGRLAGIGRSEENVKAVFVTHEHTDHIRGVDVFARKFQVPIFATKKTIDARFLCKDKALINNIKNEDSMKISSLEINSFSKSHLSADPISFSIVDLKNNKKLSVITDVGHACNNVIDAVSSSDFLCIESNYDEKMLEEGFYPWSTKKWIRSDEGHLSNVQSAACVLEHGKKKLKQVMLSHISQNNNTAQKALDTYKYFIKQRIDFRPNISISSRELATPLFRI